MVNMEGNLHSYTYYIEPSVIEAEGIVASWNDDLNQSWL